VHLLAPCLRPILFGFIVIIDRFFDLSQQSENLTLWAEWLALFAAPLSFNRQIASQVWGTEGDFP
jgi:hypothetical protein